MTPIAAPSSARLPQNASRLARSQSVPPNPVELAPTASRRRASLPSSVMPAPRPRPTFHLASGPDEDTRPRILASVPDTADHPITGRETSRRYHALTELLSTELGYLLDLRTLVSVYTPPSVSLPHIKTLPPGLSPAASRVNKPFLATTPWRFLKCHHWLLPTPSVHSRASFPVRLPPHTLPPSSRFEHTFSDQREPPLWPRFTTSHSCQSGKMRHAPSVLRVGPRRYHQKCRRDPRDP